MRKISIQSANIGDIIAKDIITDQGHILLRAGIELSSLLLSRLKHQRIDTLFIRDRMTNDIFPEETLKIETRERAMKQIRYTMNQLATQTDSHHLAASP